MSHHGQNSRIHPSIFLSTNPYYSVIHHPSIILPAIPLCIFPSHTSFIQMNLRFIHLFIHPSSICPPIRPSFNALSIHTYLLPPHPSILPSFFPYILYPHPSIIHPLSIILSSLKLFIGDLEAFPGHKRWNPSSKLLVSFTFGQTQKKGSLRTE